MSWFRPAVDPGSPDSRGALVQVLAADGSAVGAGVLVASRTVLTCAHVVNIACNARPLSGAHPGSPALLVSFSAHPGAEPVAARLGVWVPPRTPSGDGTVGETADWHGDLAVLNLVSAEPPGMRPVVWEDMAAGQEVRAWSSGGQSYSYSDVRVAHLEGPIGYLDGVLSGAAISEGFSGGPLWSVANEAAVGLVMGRIRAPNEAFSPQHSVRRSWGQSWQAIQRELAQAGFALSGDARRSAGLNSAQESVRDLMGHPLRSLLGDPTARSVWSRALARELELRAPADQSAPTVQELAELLCTEERALATLSELLAPVVVEEDGRRHLDRLLALGRLAQPVRLLSVAEHHSLLHRLRAIAAHRPRSLPRAATEALRLFQLPRSLQTAELDAAAVPVVLAELEHLPGDGSDVPEASPRLPVLLRLVEYLAADVGGDDREWLCAWNAQVACRLGVHEAALRERRADAQGWAAGQTTQADLVLVEIDRHDVPERYRCSMWRVRGNDGSAARVDLGSEVSLSGREIASRIREVVGGAGFAGDNAALVAVSVTSELLELAVDEWDGAGPDDIVPAPLGEDFRLVFRCPEIRLRSFMGLKDLSRRWKARDHGEPLVADDKLGTEAALLGLLKTTYRDAAHVVVHGAPARRQRLLLYCLALGVPIVLWDRAASGPEDADGLAPVWRKQPLDELPETVRHFRVRAYLDESVQVRPVLVWEDATLPKPEVLDFADPSEGAEPDVSQ